MLTMVEAVRCLWYDISASESSTGGEAALEEKEKR